MKRVIAALCVVLMIGSFTQAWAVSGGGTYKKYSFEKNDEESFVGKISLAMAMDTDELWKSSSSAAFGAVTVMMDIASEKIAGIDFGSISDVYLAQIKIKGEGTILAYYYFSDESYVCAIFNPDTGEITPASIEYNTTPKRAMALMYEEDVIEDFLIVDLDDIEAILKQLMG